MKSKEKSKLKRYVPVAIEHYFGEDYLAFMLEIGSEGTVQVVATKNCSLADTDGDYIFDSEYELLRIQSDCDYSSQGDDWRKYLLYLYEWAMNKEIFVSRFKDNVTGKPMYDIAFQYYEEENDDGR